MARFTVRTFGFPEIRRNDQPCHLALRKSLALLVCLSDRGEGLRRARCGRNNVVAGKLRRGRATAAAALVAPPPARTGQRCPHNGQVDGSVVVSD